MQAGKLKDDFLHINNFREISSKFHENSTKFLVKLQGALGPWTGTKQLFAQSFEWLMLNKSLMLNQKIEKLENFLCALFKYMFGAWYERLSSNQ